MKFKILNTCLCVCMLVSACMNTYISAMYIEFNYIHKSTRHVGACGSVVVKALYYKPEGRGLETR
jgi:hypothetical protein